MIYDCFTFFNELELLELRLNELSPVVDKFVLVEATKTHQGKPKPLYYEENKARFEKFADKIIHVIAEFPSHITDAMQRDHYQRSAIMEGLKSCSPDDVVIISDLDEIPVPKKIVEYKNKPGIKIFKQAMYYYYMNCRGFASGRPYFWYLSVMVPFRMVKDSQSFRGLAGRFGWLTEGKGDLLHRAYHHFRLFAELLLKFKGAKIVLVENGGWHFSYLGGTNRIVQKIEAFAHDEYNRDEYKDPAKIEAMIRRGEDIFGQKDANGQLLTWKPVPIDETFPVFLRQNLNKYSHLIFPQK